jgi:hypothetical protein
VADDLEWDVREPLDWSAAVDLYGTRWAYALAAVGMVTLPEARPDGWVDVSDVRCQVVQLGDDWTKLSDLLLPGEDVDHWIQVTKPFRVHTDNRELHESARFTFPWAMSAGRRNTGS